MKCRTRSTVPQWSNLRTLLFLLISDDIYKYINILLVSHTGGSYMVPGRLKDVGAGVVWLKKGISFPVSLTKDAKIFQAEMTAIHYCVE